VGEAERLKSSVSAGGGHARALWTQLLGFVAGTVFGLLLPGACAGLPDGIWPGAKFALDGAIRSSRASIFSASTFFM
jgi:hypothetical protein